MQHDQHRIPTDDLLVFTISRVPCTSKAGDQRKTVKSVSLPYCERIVPMLLCAVPVCACLLLLVLMAQVSIC